MADPINAHKQNRGYPGRNSSNLEKAFVKGNAVGVIETTGSLSDRSRIYKVRVFRGPSKSERIKAKAIGIDGSGLIERYQEGDRVLLIYGNNSKASQPLIVGKVNETQGSSSIKENTMKSFVERNNLPNNPDFNARPDSTLFSVPGEFNIYNEEAIFKSSQGVLIEDNQASKDNKGAGNSKQSEDNITEEAEKDLEQAKSNLRISQSYVFGESKYRLGLIKNQDTHSLLNIESAQMSIQAAELDLEEADEERRKQEAMNQCLEERNKKIEEGLENLKEKILGEAGAAFLDTVNSFLPLEAQIGIEMDEEGNITGVSLGPFNYDTESQSLSIGGQSVKYTAINSGLSILNQSLPSYLQLCLQKDGTLNVGDYGRFDIDSILEGEPNFDIGPFSMRKECRNVPAGPGASEEQCDTFVGFNDTVYGLANNALDELNSNLPAPLQVGFDRDNNVLSLGPIDLDIAEGNLSLDKASLSRTINRLSKQFLPPSAELNVSSDFEAVSLGSLTYNREDKSISVLGETIYIEESACKKDKAQSKTPLSENAPDGKQRDSADQEILPTVPPLGKQTGGRGSFNRFGRFQQTCNNEDFLKRTFDMARERNQRNSFRSNTFFNRFFDNFFTRLNGFNKYNFPNVGLESGITSDGLWDRLSSPLTKGSYEQSSFPTYVIDASELENNFGNSVTITTPPAYNLGVILTQYGIYNGGGIAQTVYDFFIDDSVFGLIDMLSHIGNGSVKTISYSIKADFGDITQEEVVSYTLDCKGSVEWFNFCTKDNKNTDTTKSYFLNQSIPNREEILDFPLSLLDWASEIDPQNQGFYQSLAQGAVTDAMVELIYQKTGRNIDALGKEYERLRSAVAKVTQGSFRGHDYQSPISIQDLDEEEAFSEKSEFSPSIEKEDFFLKSLELINPYDKAELKTGDKVTLKGEVEDHIDRVTVFGEAFSEETFSISNRFFEIEVEIEALELTKPTLKGGRIRVKGKKGQTYSLSDFGIPPLLLNDLSPSLENYSLDYPEGQSLILEGQKASLSLKARNYDQINLSGEGLRITLLEEGLYELENDKVNFAKGDEIPVVITLTRKANGTKLEKLISVEVEKAGIFLEEVKNNEIRLDIDPLNFPIDLVFNKSLVSLEVGTINIGQNQFIEGRNKAWRHYIQLSIEDIPPEGDKSWQYSLKAQSSNESASIFIPITVIGFRPFSIPIDTSQTSKFSIPKSITDNFSDYKITWISEDIEIVKVSDFSGDPLEYKEIEDGSLELSPQFRIEYINGETTLRIFSG